MKNRLKKLGIIVGGLVVILVVGAGVLFLIGNDRLSADTYNEIEGETVVVPTDAAALQRGQHLVEATSLCADCHGENLAGALFAEEPGILTMYAPNLTNGAGGIGESYTPADWERAIRHGVDIDGRGMAFMPSVSYAAMSDEDLGALIAYLQTLEPVDQELPGPNFGFPAILLTALGQFKLMPDLIDHQAEVTTVAMGVNREYGEYLVNIAACRDCHGMNLTGQTDPNAPQGPDISPSGEIRHGSMEDFLTVMRTGTIPSTGRVLSEEMPWRFYAKMTDEELQAIYLYLRSMPSADGD